VVCSRGEEGKGKLTKPTGRLGEVMKESVEVAFKYVKVNCEKFGIDSKALKSSDIDIHVPEGATPKDGPSAGIALTTAIISALVKQAIPMDIGMTGEIDLLGNVLPIGGLREKAIAAHRS
ncbi:7119_t:CDS:1, partial [Funneliformis geosporum]